MPGEKSKIETELKENPSQRYSSLLGDYIRITKQVRNLQNRYRGINDPEISFELNAKDQDRHEAHLELIKAAQKLDRTKDDVLIDIIRQENTLEEYGLPEFSILTADDLIDSEDWHDPDYFHVDTDERRPLIGPIPDWVKKRKSLISSEDVMLVFSISPVEDYGGTTVYPEDYRERVCRANVLAKEINGKVFQKVDTGYHDASAHILGVLLPKKDLEKVAGIIRNNPDKFRLGEQFYEKERKLLLNRINTILQNFGSARQIDKLPGFVEFTETLIGKKVVMVDDDTEVFEAFVPNLIVATGNNAEFIGYTGQSADELVKQIASPDSDVVLLDYHLSDILKGTDVAKALKAKGFSGLIFGFTSDHKAPREFMKAGAKNTINKNVKSPEDSIQAIALNLD